MGEFSRIYKTDLTDRQLMDFWGLVIASGRARSFAYCLPPMDGHAFAEWMRKPDVHPWIVTCRSVPVGLFLLTEKAGKRAEVHFCTLPTGIRRTHVGRMGLTKAMGLFSLASALWERDSAGRFVLDTLVGFTPASNAKAVKYAASLGGDCVGLIPGYCYFHDTAEHEAAVVNCYTRASVPERAARL